MKPPKRPMESQSRTPPDERTAIEAKRRKLSDGKTALAALRNSITDKSKLVVLEKEEYEAAQNNLKTVERTIENFKSEMPSHKADTDIDERIKKAIEPVQTKLEAVIASQQTNIDELKKNKLELQAYIDTGFAKRDAPRVRNVATQILLRVARPEPELPPNSRFSQMLNGRDNRKVRNLAREMDKEPRKFVSDCDQLIRLRNEGFHFFSEKNLDQEVKEVLALITPLVKSNLPFECEVIEKYETMKNYFCRPISGVNSGS